MISNMTKYISRICDKLNVILKLINTTYFLWILIVTIKMNCNDLYKIIINNVVISIVCMLTSKNAFAKTREYPVGVPNDISIANLLSGANCKKPYRTLLKGD